MRSIAVPTLLQESSLQRYLEEIKAFPVLTEQEEMSLAISWHDKGDLAAAHKLVTSHLRLVAKIAMQYQGYGLPMVDMISEGNIGLMTAVKKFNPYLGNRLSTYAIWWIKANIQDFILKSWSAVKMGTSNAHKKLFFNLKKIRSKLLQLNNGHVVPNESELIANELHVSKSEVEEMVARFDNQEISLNDTAYEDGNEIIELVAEPGEDQEIKLLNSNEYQYQKNKFHKAFKSALNPREQEIITARRLLEKPERLEALSKKYGVSSERIRQIEDRAMQKLIAHVKSS